MGRAIPISIGDEFFRTREEARIRVRQLVAKYEPNEYLDATDAKFARNLFQHHPDYEQKAGSGISSVQVRLDIYGNKHFQIHRVDGTDDDISWVHCIASRKQ